MKNEILYELLRAIKAKPGLARKVKIFAVVGVGGFLITGALLIWAGVSAISYVASSANQVIQTAKVPAPPKLQVINCWGKAQSLLAVQPWLERPALANLATLKVACFEQKPNLCQGPKCEQIKELINTAEGSFL